MNRLMVVVPCYNEEEVLPETISQLAMVIEQLLSKEKIAANSGVLFVNDGSRDHTWEIITQAHSKNPYIYGLNLAGNVGHQNALLAGLDAVRDNCSMTISIDADLQDDIAVIEQMVDKYLQGADIVYGVRNDRTQDHFFKRFSAQSFYKVMSSLGVKTIYNHADFRLMSQRALTALFEYKERNLFLRGIVPTIGYSCDCVYYSRKKRMAGESKYPLRKMLSFAWDGITSFPAGKLAMSPALHIEVSNKGEHHSSDKVDEQVFHSVQNTDIQVTAQTQRDFLPVGGNHNCFHNVGNDDPSIPSCGVQHNGGNGVDYGVLLHVQIKHLIHGTLEKLP